MQPKSILRKPYVQLFFLYRLHNPSIIQLVLLLMPQVDPSVIDKHNANLSLYGYAHPVHFFHETAGVLVTQMYNRNFKVSTTRPQQFPQHHLRASLLGSDLQCLQTSRIITNTSRISHPTHNLPCTPLVPITTLYFQYSYCMYLMTIPNNTPNFLLIHFGTLL